MVATLDRAKLWDEVDGLVAQSRHDDPVLEERIRSDLAELRYVQGESAPSPSLTITAEVADPNHPGYSGEYCPDCGSMALARDGTNLLCHNCGNEAS
jgi:hypothetical protein